MVKENLLFYSLLQVKDIQSPDDILDTNKCFKSKNFTNIERQHLFTGISHRVWPHRIYSDPQLKTDKEREKKLKFVWENAMQSVLWYVVRRLKNDQDLLITLDDSVLFEVFHWTKRWDEKLKVNVYKIFPRQSTNRGRNDQMIEELIIEPQRLPILLRTLRKEKGLTQTEIGALVGRSAGGISMYENDHRKIHLEFLEKVGGEFGFNVFVCLRKIEDEG